jgi:DNA invertase Pin-like site-specific DNA recombinase
MKELIGYLRVSTDEQGQTRNGLEAQREAIVRFAADNGYRIVEIVEEVASGKLGSEDRPVLAAAMAKAAKGKNTFVVVSKLDRLSRSSAFINNLMDNAKVRFIVTELGESVDNFMLRIYAAVAQQEREVISQRTKAGLAAKKARGEALGASRPIILKAGTVGRQFQADKADEFANKLKPTVKRMVDAGMSLRAIADELNSNGTRTARGGAWAATTVKNLIARF